MTIRPSTRPRRERAAASTPSVSAWELEIRIWSFSRRAALVDAADDLGEELAVEVGEQDAEGVGAAGGQGPGGPVGPVVEAAAASQTRRRASSLTRVLPLKTRETVAMETPEACATSRMVVTIELLAGERGAGRRPDENRLKSDV